MTAKYWARQKITLEDPILESLTNALTEARNEQELLQKEIAQNKALTSLLKETVETLGFKLCWKREKKGCGLPEIKICPKGSLNQLTFQEIQLMREFVTSKEFAHFPIRSLQYYTKRETHWPSRKICLAFRKSPYKFSENKRF
jgi:hypothetical protein